MGMMKVAYIASSVFTCVNNQISGVILYVICQSVYCPFLIYSLQFCDQHPGVTTEVRAALWVHYGGRHYGSEADGLNRKDRGKKKNKRKNPNHWKNKNMNMSELSSATYCLHKASPIQGACPTTRSSEPPPAPFLICQWANPCSSRGVEVEELKSCCFFRDMFQHSEKEC